MNDSGREAQIIVLANQKGGVGKTTTTVMLGHGLAMRGLKTLIVDLDPRGHAALALGMDPQPGLFDLVIGRKPPGEVITKARDNLDLLPGDESSEDVTTHVTLMSRRREQVLRDHLEPVLGEYDAVLFDCAPSRNILHRAALGVADWLIIPTQLSTLDVHGVRLIVEMVREIRADLPDTRVQLAGVLPTRYERRTKETIAVWRELSNLYSEYLWAPIPEDVRVREAPAYSRTLWEYAPNTNAVIGFEVRNGGGKRVGGYKTVLDNMLNLMLGK